MTRKLYIHALQWKVLLVLVGRSLWYIRALEKICMYSYILYVLYASYSKIQGIDTYRLILTEYLCFPFCLQ
jgi:hypothetical protein